MGRSLDEGEKSVAWLFESRVVFARQGSIDSDVVRLSAERCRFSRIFADLTSKRIDFLATIPVAD